MRAYGMPRRLCSQSASKGCLGSSGYTENNLQPRQPKFAAFKAENFACRIGFSLGKIHLRPKSKLPPRSPWGGSFFVRAERPETAPSPASPAWPPDTIRDGCTSRRANPSRLEGAISWRARGRDEHVFPACPRPGEEQRGRCSRPKPSDHSCRRTVLLQGNRRTSDEAFSDPTGR